MFIHLIRVRVRPRSGGKQNVIIRPVQPCIPRPPVARYLHYLTPGSAPCRVDLEVFGYLRAIRDMDTFSDSLKNTKLAGWYRAMEDQVPAPVLRE